MTNKLGPGDQRTCAALTAGGKACRMRPLLGSDYCFTHAPERAAERARTRKLGGRRRRRVSAEGVPERVPLATVGDAQALLERAARDALMLDLSPDRCRVLVAAVGRALDVFKVGEVETRLAALEEQLGVGDPRPAGRLRISP